MKKRKRKKKRRQAPMGQKSHRRWPTAELNEVLDKAERLVKRGRAWDAVELLEPLLETYPRVANLHYAIGVARAEVGDVWGGLAGFERALELSHDPDHWLPLAALYLQADLHTHALHAFHQALRLLDDGLSFEAVHRTVDALEENVMEVTHDLELPASQVEKGLRRMEVGQRALHTGDYAACITASQRAAKLLDDWPPPRNNLSQALFLDGQPEEAIAVAYQILEQFPENVQALGNAIRFLAWTGQEAQPLWARLKEITPQGTSSRIKKADAAAIMNEDEIVYQLLKPLDDPDAAQKGTPGLSQIKQFHLAVAEANTGRREARRHLRALQHNIPWAGDFLAALKAGQPGPGRMDRFPYFDYAELLPRQRMDEFIDLCIREDEMPPEKFRAQMAHFVARYPQIVLVAEKMVWESDDFASGLDILETIATPAAHAAMRRFGLSQAGDDDVRMQALYALMRAGEIAQDEMVRVWMDGEWREIQLRQFEFIDEPDESYAPEVEDLLNQGRQALEQRDREQAERLYQRALDLEPRATDAYNNLGVIYARRGDHERAKEMYRAALEVNPLYVFSRSNLANYLLDEGDVEGAEAMLAPLASVTRFYPQDMARYSYIQARVLVHQKEYDAARYALQIALDVYPGYEPAQDLLEHLEMVGSLQGNWEAFFERGRKRHRDKRARLQATISTAEPALSEVLPAYTKNALTGMARVILPRGGWSALRKAELIQRIIAELDDRDNLERIVDGLDDDGLTALRQVLAGGGSMPWRDFDDRYGNDLEEFLSQRGESESAMGRLRRRGLLAEATVDGELLVVVPAELRQVLRDVLG